MCLLINYKFNLFAKIKQDHATKSKENKNKKYVSNINEPIYKNELKIRRICKSRRWSCMVRWNSVGGVKKERGERAEYNLIWW